jgi:hypothetical protein
VLFFVGLSEDRQADIVLECLVYTLFAKLQSNGPD